MYGVMDCLEDAFKFGCNLNPIGMLGKGLAEEAGYVCGYAFSLQFGLRLQCLFSFVSAGGSVFCVAIAGYTVFSSAKRRLLFCLEFVLLMIMIVICSAFKFRFRIE